MIKVIHNQLLPAATLPSVINVPAPNTLRQFLLHHRTVCYTILVFFLKELAWNVMNTHTYMMKATNSNLWSNQCNRKEGDIRDFKQIATATSTTVAGSKKARK